jgi:hypothetical protein
MDWLRAKNPMTSENHNQFRTKTIGVRVTSDDYELLQSTANAHGKSLSEWCRGVLLQVARNPEGNSLEKTMINEMSALRTILEELTFCHASKTPLTFDDIEALWNQADDSKHKKAVNFLRQETAKKVVPLPQKGWSKR